ncbi:MAG: T9SS type A sorting domain-containing protein [Candidatus Delongbacteria bacterium]|nr:T9SS type A sorting domain-containing protein [Candidatus Delongbacteria bacterium]
MKIFKKMCIILIIISACYSDEYIVPMKPASVDVADIDFDGDLDIVIGHHYSNDWSGITTLSNNGKGIFSVIDSFYFGGSHGSLHLLDLDKDNNYDIITEYYDDVENVGIGILFDFYNNLHESHYFLDNGASNFKLCDIDDDSNIDVTFCSNPYFFWGYIKNDGDGIFTSPVYYNLDYPPQDLEIGDLNNDGREDILIGGQLDSWLNYDTGLEYHEIPDSIHANTIKVADIDNDLDNDIIGSVWYMPGTSKKLVIYTNDGSGNFELTYSKWIDEALTEMFISDLNKDDYPEIIYNVSYSYPNSDYELFHTYILFNNQDGTFRDPIDYYTGICSHKSFVADLDGNGRNDIITLNYDFYNPPPSRGTIHILFQDSLGGFVEESQTSIDNGQLIMDNYELSQNYPNPFNNQTNIQYQLKSVSKIEINIFNPNGQFVRSLVNEKMGKGNHSVMFDANNLNSGIYYYQLKIDGKVMKTKKMLYLR